MEAEEDRRNPVGRLGEWMEAAGGRERKDDPTRYDPYYYDRIYGSVSMDEANRAVARKCKRLLEGGMIKRTIRTIKDYLTRPRKK